MKSRLIVGIACLGACWPLSAQDPPDQFDPTEEEEEVERPRLDERDRSTELVLPEAAPRTDATEAYAVGAIIIEGAEALTANLFLDIIARYSARTLSPGELSQLANDIAERAREQGYIFASATIEPQSLDGGVLRIRLDEGAVDEIRLTGDEDAAVRSLLEPLRSGRPVTLSMLERHVLLADDLAGVWIRRTQFAREQGRGVLIVDVSRSRFSGALELENDGSRAVGPERARAHFDANGLFSSFDELDVTLSVTPFEPQELRYGRARYGVVVSRSGTEVAVSGSYSRTELGGLLSDREIEGEFWRVGASISQPLLRSRAASVWLQGEFEFSELTRDRRGELSRRDRIPVARASLYTLAKAAGGDLRGRLTFSQGLDVLGATRAGDPLASRDDASAEFSTLSALMDWRRPLGGEFAIQLGGRGQLATSPLLLTEDIGLGGTRFVRGYEFNERSGDEGIMGYGELQYDWSDPLGIISNIELYAFADGGVVGNLEGGRGGGSLASGGGGFRAEISRDLDVDFEIAAPLTGPRFDTDDSSPRLNFRVRHAL
jgi:hemolysin activation/secretion protein